MYMAAGTAASFRLAERTTKLLAGAPIVRGFPILVHSKARITNGIASWKFLRVFRVVLIERDNGLTVVNVLHQMVDILHIVALITQEGTLPEGQDGVGGGEDFLHNGGIGCIGGGRQLISPLSYFLRKRS